MRHTYNRLGLNPLLFMPQISATSVSGATIIATIAVAGGMSVAAKNSLPGDMLYSMKISVNEDVLRSLTFSLAS